MARSGGTRARVARRLELGLSRAEIARRLGISRPTVTYDAEERGAIVPRPQAMPIDDLLAGPRSRSHVKRRLLRAGLLDDRCGRCGISGWLGEPLALELHHRNGVNDDNRLENLVMLCPNCHSLTETYSGRNRGRPRAS